jgi:Flp pilus assembly protein TadG
MNNRKKRQRGSAVIEFTLVGIPMIFVLISVFEISRGMWNYHTLAYAVKEGTRYAIVHGSDCSSDPQNTCGVTLGQVAQRIQDAGIGLDPSQLQLTFTSSGSSTTCTLNACIANATGWPAAPFENKRQEASSPLAPRFPSNRLWPCFGPAPEAG